MKILIEGKDNITTIEKFGVYLTFSNKYWKWVVIHRRRKGGFSPQSKLGVLKYASAPPQDPGAKNPLLVSSVRNVKNLQ